LFNRLLEQSHGRYVSAADKQKAVTAAKALEAASFNASRNELAEPLKLTSQDKDLAKLAKSAETSWSRFHKCVRCGRRWRRSRADRRGRPERGLTRATGPGMKCGGPLSRTPTRSGGHLPARTA
jgi:hypothetical protein